MTTLAQKLVAAGLSVGTALGGAYLIGPHEGAVKNKQGYHVTYIDAVGVPTICYGQTGKGLYNETIKLGMKYTEQECIQLLARTLKDFEKKIDALVKVPYASDYEQAALTSFTYNAGLGSFASSTLIAKLNAGDHVGACDQLSRWVYAKKQKLQGLVNRREDERNWCLGSPPQNVKVVHSQLVDLFIKTSDAPPPQK